MKTSMLLALLLASLPAANAAAAPGDVIPGGTAFFFDDIANGDEFGAGVATDGTLVVVGAPRDNPGDDYTGSAHVLDVATRTRLLELLADDGEGGDLFGEAVAIDGNRVLVGAPGAWAAYLFDATTGAQLHKLEASGINPTDFGASVALRGNLALVGAPRENSPFSNLAGAAYLFDVTTGLELARLGANDFATGDRFGGAVALHDDAAVIGAIGGDDNGSNSGSIYLFELVTYTQLVKLSPADGAAGDEFGGALAVSGDVVAIGAALDDDGASNAGSVYFFDVTTWQELGKIVASDASADDHFGTVVAIDGTTVLVGAPDSDEAGSDSGSAYLFDRLSGNELAKLVPSDGDHQDAYGGAVALHGTSVAIGARLADIGNYVASDGGVAYLLDAVPSAARRNAGANPWSLDAGPVWTGGTLRLTVDLTTTGHTHALVFGLDSPFELTLGGGQTLLCIDSGQGELINTGLIEGPLAMIDLAVPSLPDLVGFPVHMQALHAFGVAPFALSNACDLVVGGCAYGQPWSHKLLATDAVASEELGEAIAVDGTTAVVGAHDGLVGGVETGSAYVFDTTTGAQIAKLVADDGAENDSFGTSVAVHGSLAVVGAPYHDSGAGVDGAAYVFDTVTGVQLHELTPSAVTSVRFGASVAIHGNTVLVGAPYDDANGFRSGSVYVFDAVTGAEVTQLLASDGAAFDVFGQGLAIDADTILIGAYGDSGPADFSGTAYLFDATTMLEIMKIAPSDGGVGDCFGYNVALSGTTAIVASHLHQANGEESGAAYLFDVATGTEITKLVPTDGRPGNAFGRDVAIFGDRVLIGSEESAAAYLFDATTGVQLDRLDAGCDGTGAGRFGSSVAINATHAFVGARGNDDDAVDSGGAFVFDLP